MTCTATSSILAGPASADGLPAWWQESRREAWARFQELPMPVRKDEDWRFANISALDLGSYQTAGTVGSEDREKLIERSAPGFPVQGRAVFANDELIDWQGLPAELAGRGVIWEPLSQAVARHPDLVRQYFMTQPVALGSDKFAALHRAFCRAGMFLYVPKNVECTLPLAVFHWLSGARASVFPHTLIVAEAHSRVTVVDFYRSASEDPGFACGVNDVFVGAGAQVTYIASQSWSENALSFQLSSTRVSRDASSKSLFVNTGARYSRIESKSTLVEQGGRSEMLSITVGDRNQEFDQRTLQDHVAPNTWSDLLYKNALNFRSKSIFKGLIRVEPGAARTDAYQTNRNLLLSPEAEADTMPGLEILNDDVKCSHGATTGQLDEAQMFYFLQRGIPPATAKKLMAFGFFEEVLARVGEESIAQAMRQEVESKFLRSQPATGVEEAVAAPEETDVRELQGTQ
jgi:Fe-S cluster assembly protein SufD